MGNSDRQSVTDDMPALEWAHRFVAFDRPELVSDAPWARTLNLSGLGPSAFLKLFPSHQRGQVDVWQRLAARFPSRLPQVLATSPESGWLLTSHHESRELDYDADKADFCSVLRSYAQMQADAARDMSGFGDLRRIEFSALVPRLLAFLGQGPEVRPDGQVGAAYFLGEERARSYERQFVRHADRLQSFLRDAPALPLTLNHGDLRPPNTALRDDGSAIFLDWDDVCTGPAGLSLHGLFGGCVKATLLLGDTPLARAAAGTPEGLMVHAYLQTLLAGGYADENNLRRGLPSSLCAGLISFIIDFGAYPDEEARSDIQDTVNDRLSDLLDLCDWLGSQSPAQAMALARFYENLGEHPRAHSLYRDQVAKHREDVSRIAALAGSKAQLGLWDEARECQEEILRLAPGQPEALLGLARTYRARLKFEEAEQAARQALTAKGYVRKARAELDAVQRLRSLRAAAAEAEAMPTLRLTAIQQDNSALQEDEIALAAELFSQHGTLQIDNAFPPELISELHDAFFDRYTAYFKQADHPDALRLGDKRYMLTVDMKAPFDKAGLLEAPRVLPIVRRLLGDDCVLGAFTAVISLPGSKDQQLHKDHTALFPDTEHQYTVPPFATQLVVPLVPLDEWTGTTRFFKGSHRVSTEDAASMPHQDPHVPLGSCLLMDYRCAHHGLGNRSQKVRPILTLIFNRPWFRDYLNYSKQPPLRFADEAFAGWPEQLRAMVDWWHEERRVAGLARAALG